MRRPISSIRLRLVLAAMATILVALTTAGIMLVSMFENHVERRLVAVLETDVRELISGLTLADDGSITLARFPNDQRYEQPFSGSYWQVSKSGRVVERSRSLWDEVLALPDDSLADGQHEHVVKGPQDRALIAVEHQVVVNRADGPMALRFAAALDRSDVDTAVRSFRDQITWMLLVLGGLLLTSFALAVGVGLAPLSRLRTDLGEMRSGAVHRLSGHYPAEVARLVEDLNQLLDQREKAAERAGRRAADLAHGLKTPITAISVIAEELADRGDEKLAEELAQYAAAMQRYVERELTLTQSLHARLNTKPTALGPIIGLLVESLKRLPRGNELVWDVDVAALAVGADATAVTEILGNLLDNARKWAVRYIRVRAQAIGSEVRILVSDDGPGVEEADLPALTARGQRLDRSKPGSGLGLSIVREIIDELGGRLDLTNAPGGGLVVTITLPAAQSALQ